MYILFGLANVDLENDLIGDDRHDRFEFSSNVNVLNIPSVLRMQPIRREGSRNFIKIYTRFPVYATVSSRICWKNISGNDCPAKLSGSMNLLSYRGRRYANAARPVNAVSRISLL